MAGIKRLCNPLLAAQVYKNIAAKLALFSLCFCAPMGASAAPSDVPAAELQNLLKPGCENGGLFSGFAPLLALGMPKQPLAANSAVVVQRLAAAVASSRKASPAATASQYLQPASLCASVPVGVSELSSAAC